MNLLEPVLKFDDAFAKLRTVNNHFAVRIVENVENFFGAIAVIDVHMGQAPLKTSRHQLAIFGSVAHVEGHLGTIARSALTQCARDIIRTRGHFGPSDDPVAVYQRRSVLRHGGLDSVENVTEVPVDHFPSPCRTGQPVSDAPSTSVLRGLDPALQCCRLGPHRFGSAKHLPVESNAFEPVVETDQVRESHPAMHFGGSASDKAMDFAGV